jgi:dephospho-CoA kinase
MMPYRLGLTGSIGMGKSTTAAMFAAERVPVWDADAAVRRLYAPGGGAVTAVAALCPTAIAEDGGVSRDLLRTAIADDPALLDRLSAAVHPLVQADRAAWLAGTTAPVIVLDVPLLFETGADRDCDGIAVVSVPAKVQRARVLSRPGMTVAALDLLLARQMPDAEKRARATWVIDTSTLDGARRKVRQILRTIHDGQPDARSRL